MTGKYILEAWGHADPKMQKEERARALWLLFWCFFLPLGLPYVNWTSQECCLSHLRSSLRSSDLPLFYFHGLFPCLFLATTILDSCFLFYLPNNRILVCPCLPYFTWDDSLYFHSWSCTWHYFLLIMVGNIALCTCAPSSVSIHVFP